MIGNLADDLLKQHSVPELRELVISLEQEADSKKTELQSMVGSKYHDFIQSADKISNMKKTSVQCESLLKECWDINQKLLNYSSYLITLIQDQHTDEKDLDGKINSSSNNLVHSIKRTQDFSSERIWSCLNNCRVIEATSILTGAKIIIDFHQNEQSKSKMYPFNLFEFSSSNAFTSIERQELSRLSLLDFLSKTVCDDCRLILLEDTKIKIEHKAHALACLSILWMSMFAENSKISIKKRIFQTYLQFANRKIMQIYDELNTIPVDDVNAVGNGLVKLVHLLQEVIIEIYLLFLQKTSEPFHPLPPGIGAVGGDGGMVSGWVKYYQIDILTNATTMVNATVFQFDTSKRVNGSPVNGFTFDLDTFLVELDRPFSDYELKVLSISWLKKTLRSVTEQCKSMLASFTSATDVAYLQQLVRLHCCHRAQHAPSMGHTVAPSVWNEVSHELLASLLSKTKKQPQQHSSSSQKESCETMMMNTPKEDRGDRGVVNTTDATVLWNVTFRASFLHQVERLLRKSCQKIFTEAKRLLIDSLRKDGLIVEPNTLSVSIDRSKLNENFKKTKRNSVEIYRTADKIRSFLEDSVADLLADIIYPVSGRSSLDPQTTWKMKKKDEGSDDLPIVDDEMEDSLSIHALHKAMNTQCCQLVGQFMILLRVVGERCRDVLVTASPSLSESPSPSGLFVDTLYRTHEGGLKYLPSDGSSKGLDRTQGGMLIMPNVLKSSFFGGPDEDDDDLIDESQPMEADLDSLLDTDLLPVKPKPSKSNNLGEAEKESTLAMKRLAKTLTPSSWLSKTTGLHPLERSSDADRLLVSKTLTTSLLLLGRIGWLLTVKGGFLKYALQFQDSSPEQQQQRHPSHLVAMTLDLNSEDQIKSAFEIADSDGDGVLTFAEAIEAVQVLVITEGPSPSMEHPTASSPYPNYKGLSEQLTPCVTYEEFTLLLGPELLQFSEFYPDRSYQMALNRIVSFVHVVWAIESIQLLSRSLVLSALNEVNLLAFHDVLASKSPSRPSRQTKDVLEVSIERQKTTVHSSQGHFRLLWTPRWIDLMDNLSTGEEGEGVGRERMMIPSQCTLTMSNFLYEVKLLVSNYLMSIDTLQELTSIQPFSRSQFSTTASSMISRSMSNPDPPVNPSDPPSKPTLESTRRNLFHEVAISVVSQLAFNQLHSLFIELTHVLSSAKLRGGKSSSNDNVSMNLEDVAMQIIFDVMCCHKLHLNCFQQLCDLSNPTLPPSPTTATLRRNQLKLRYEQIISYLKNEHLDVITAELVFPLLDVASTQFIERSELILFPYLKETQVTKAFDTTYSNPSASDESSDVLKNVFVSSSSHNPLMRFGLLPLGIVTSSPLSHGHKSFNRSIMNEFNEMDKTNPSSFEKKKLTSNPSSFNNPPTTSNSSNSLNSKSFISSFGNFLGK